MDALVGVTAGRGQAAGPRAVPVAPEDEMRRISSDVLTRLAAAANSTVMRGDPYREVFIALTAFVETMPDLVRLVGSAGHVLPEADRKALCSELVAATREASAATMRKESARWLGAFDRRTTIFIAVGFTVAMFVGLLVGSAATIAFYLK